jgi:hypothetical protein
MFTAYLTPVALIVAPVAITAGSLYMTCHLIVIGK